MRLYSSPKPNTSREESSTVHTPMYPDSSRAVGGDSRFHFLKQVGYNDGVSSNCSPIIHRS
jgi:hypothetical protein